MAQQSKTQIYLKVKKPLLERQRRARINNSLDSLKKLVAELQADEAILRMDKAELLEQTLTFVRKQIMNKTHGSKPVSTDYFRHGYMNAVNEVSRVMASKPGMNVAMGKAVMIHLGSSYNRLQNQQKEQEQRLQRQQFTAQQQQQVLRQQSKYEHMHSPLHIECSPPLSPASSGYHSDYESTAASPVAHKIDSVANNLWRPW